jgi:hypothetical protein
MERKPSGFLRRGIKVVLAVCVVALLVGSAAAQDMTIRIDGPVLWVAADAMVIAPFENGAFPVKIDLSEADQDESMRLTTGDVVTAIGTIAPEGDRVIATTIRRV